VQGTTVAELDGNLAISLRRSMVGLAGWLPACRLGECEDSLTSVLGGFFGQWASSCFFASDWSVVGGAVASRRSVVGRIASGKSGVKPFLSGVGSTRAGGSRGPYRSRTKIPLDSLSSRGFFWALPSFRADEVLGVMRFQWPGLRGLAVFFAVS